MKKIKLTGGKCTLVDDSDYEMLNQFTWHQTSNGYAVMYYEGKSILMHRLIMSPSNDEVVDHINHERLDNQKSNMRVVTQQVNTFNSGNFGHNTSGAKGISWDKVNRKWRSCIKLDGKQITLGRFRDKETASNIRENAEIQLWSAS